MFPDHFTLWFAFTLIRGGVVKTGKAWDHLHMSGCEEDVGRGREAGEGGEGEGERRGIHCS